MNDAFEIVWHDGGREPKMPPNPLYPNGVDFDCSRGATKTCTAILPYPAKRCGVYSVACKVCGFTLAVTAAGRVDDPKSIKVACKIAGTA